MWKALRADVLAVVEKDLRRRHPNLRLTPIDAPALAAARPWAQAQQVGWEWRRVINRYPANRFDLAIWSGETLCGLAYGPAKAEWVGIEYLEGNPDPKHPLRGQIIQIAVDVLEAQALAADAMEMRLLRPFPELIEIYERREYLPVAPVPEPAYLVKQRARS